MGEAVTKTVSIIGPDSARVTACAEKLRELVRPGTTVIVGAGPEARPDVVVAVVGDPTAEDVDIAQAVSESVGFVVLIVDATPRPWPHYPGWHSVESVEGAATLVNRACVDLTAWAGDAQRADAERLERVRMAIRLASHRISAELLGEVLGEPPGEQAKVRDRKGGAGSGTSAGASAGLGVGAGAGVSESEAEQLHQRFVQRLRVAVAEQGVCFPRVDTGSPALSAAAVSSTAPTPPHSSPRPTRERISGWALAAAGGLAGAAGVGALTYRITGSALAAIVAALLVWCALVGVRLWLVRSRHRAAQRRANAQRLREVWIALVADVISRLHIPRIADTIPTLPRGLNTHARRALL